MITKKMIEEGLSKGFVKIVNSPNGDGAVCQIGDNWFYFGGQTAEGMSATEYVGNVPKKDIVNEIFDVLQEFDRLPEFQDEALYYEFFLEEAFANEDKTVLSPEVEEILDYELVDDCSEHGGISFAGETVRDFIESCFDEHDGFITLDVLNDALRENGIRPPRGRNAKTFDRESLSTEFRNEVHSILLKAVGEQYAHKILEYGDDWFYHEVEYDVEVSSGFQETGIWTEDDIRFAIGRAILKLF